MEFLIHLSIKSTIILLLSGSLLWLLKNASATLRHWIISLTMIGLLGLPLFLGFLPEYSVTVSFLPSKQISTTTAPIETSETIEYLKVDNERQLPPHSTFAPNKERGRFDNDLIEIADNQIDTVSRIEETTNQPFILFKDLLFSIWLMGILFFIIKFLIGRYLIYKITINSEPFLLPETLGKYVLKTIKKQVVVLESKAIKTPMTWGGIKPIILLPKEAKLWTENTLKTVFVHELTHIKRNDYWLHTLGLLAVCLYWFHPLIWLMKKHQLLEREKACDEAVLNAGIQQHNYAQQLINFARQLSGQSPLLKEHALPIAKVSQTKARVLAILKFDQQRFTFSKWKQWNWGLFYAFLFPVLAAFSPTGEVIRKHFILPKLDNINHFLTTRNPPKLSFSSPRIEIQQSEIVKPNLSTPNPTLIDENSASNDGVNELQKLVKQYNLLPINRTEENIDLPKRLPETGLYGQWKEGKSEFTIWTYGEYKTIPEAPYIEVISEDGLIVIEEYKEGLFVDKENELILTKAPYDGVHFKWRYKNRADITEQPIILKGTPIQFWSNNSNLKSWLSKNKTKITTAFQDKTRLVKVAVTDTKWKKKIKEKKEWVNYRFVSKEIIEAKIERKRRRTELKSGKIPYRKLDCSIEEGQSNIIGRTNLSGKEIGNDLLNKSLSPKGTQYITVLKGNAQPALVKAFNFHLSKNEFQDLSFELKMYNVVNGEIQYAITKSPIPIQVKKGNGWIKKDLSSYGIITQGDVLVILENTDFSGAKNGKGLYFSLTDDYEVYEPIISSNFEWKNRRILERAFVMNLELEQAKSLSFAKEKNTGEASRNIVEWEDGRSEFSVWIHGAFKYIDEAPYIEVVSPDGIVIIEEYEDGLLMDKSYKLLLSKAPYDGRMRPHSWRKSIFDSPLIEKGRPIKIWDRILSNGSYDKWMKTKGRQVAQYLSSRKQDYSVQTKISENKKWSEKIERGRRQVDFHFFPEDEILAKKERQRKSNELQSGKIPYRQLDYSIEEGQSSIIGRTVLSGKDMGNDFLMKSWNYKGTQYITSLEGNSQPALIKAFNFHLSKNDFDNLSFELELYNVVNREIEYAITKSPIPIQVKKGIGWIKIDLSSYGIISQGNVLVVLENTHFSEPKKNDKGLYFSLTDDYEAYEPIVSSIFEWKNQRILDQAFIMNLEVEQHLN